MPSRLHVQLAQTRVSRAEGLARSLEEEIVERGLNAGERLGTKEDLRKRFGVAAATVNEALRLLEARGMIEARPGPGGGVFVAAPSSRVRLNGVVLGFKVSDAPFSDALALRNALEPLVCKEAAKHCRPRDAKALRRLVARLEEKVEDPVGFLHVNWELHRKLAEMGGNAPAEMLYLTLLDYVEEGVQEVEPESQSFNGRDNLEIHRELVEAVIAGEPKRLDRAIESHTPIAERWSQDEQG
jgi:DNA-binding FadR family transcriptional regulator